MIPTWNPNPDFLETAVASVLSQFGPDQPLQLELVDDSSPDFDVASFTDRFGPGQLSWHRHDQRLGLAGNWNACIARSKYPLVHILHQDDCVLDGFYTAVKSGFKLAPEAAAAFSASYFIDESGTGWAPRLNSHNSPGILEDWRQQIFVNLSIQCSAIVVRREIYQSLGGFDPDLDYTLDWDLWKRMAVRHPIWFDPRPLACFRRHTGSETSRQRKSGEHVKAIFSSIDRSAVLLPPEVAEQTTHRARRHYSEFAIEEALGALLHPGGWRTSLSVFNLARRQSSTLYVATRLVKVMVRACIRPITTHWGQRTAIPSSAKNSRFRSSAGVRAGPAG